MGELEASLGLREWPEHQARLADRECWDNPEDQVRVCCEKSLIFRLIIHHQFLVT